MAIVEGTQTTLRPTGDTRIGQLAVTNLTLTAAGIAAVLFHGVGGAVVSGTLLSVGVVAFLRWRRGARAGVEFRAGRAVLLDGSGGETTMAVRGAGGRVVRVDVVDDVSRARQLWLDASGHCLASLPEAAWDRDELERLRVAVGLPIETRAQPVTRADVRRLYPPTQP